MMRILAFHGSPGGPKDFLFLQKGCEKVTKTVQWIFSDRYNDSSDVTSALERHTHLVLGYSWGCVLALESAVELARQGKRPDGVFLIAPYLVKPKPLSGGMKTLLSLPLLSNLLLTLKLKSVIMGLLKDSSAPAAIPDYYKYSCQFWAKAKYIKKALLEKELYPQTKIEKLLQELASFKIPLFILSGDSDQTSGPEQLALLKKYLPDLQAKQLTQAGHALPWTHIKECVTELLTFGQEITTLPSDDNHQFEQNKQVKKFGYENGTSEYNNVYSFLRQHMAKDPSHTILSWVDRDELSEWKKNPTVDLPHRSVTVKQLDQLIGKIAAGLLDLGMKPGDRTLIFLPMGLPLYAAMFALQKIGCIPVFLDSWARKDQMSVSAEIAAPKMIISFEMAYDYLKGDPILDSIPLKIVGGPFEGDYKQRYTERLENLMITERMGKVVPLEKEATALITFTTGSSGRPKGADRSHRFLCAQHYALNRHLPYEKTDRDLPVFPIFSLNNLAAGVTTVIPAIDVGTPSEDDAMVLIAQMKTAGVTCTTLSPSLLNAVSKYCLEQGLTLPFLRRIITGGAPVGRDDLKKIKQVCPEAEVLVLYGSTEVEPMAHIEAQEFLEQNTRALTDEEWVDEGVNVGKMDEGLLVKFIKISKENLVVMADSDWNTLEVPSNTVGEIIVAGEHVCEKYYNDTEAIKRAKIKDHQGRVWHRTGDLGRVDENGNLWIVGRVHNAINRANEYQFPVRAEMVLKKINQVARAAYLGMPDEKLGQACFAVVSLKENLAQESENIKERVLYLMAKNGIPVDRVIIRSDIPMDPRHHSKVEYDVLRKALTEEGQ
jgi:acyl-CoA synthetase (AMP-forming)/AMP-acid ligase II/pimeloyl-ACP methyl ester carboxylesterase